MVLAGVDERLGDFTEFLVEVLGRSPQDVEGLLGGDPRAFHQDALGLSDHLAGQYRPLQVGAALVCATSINGGIESGRRQRGEDHPLGPVVAPVGVGEPGVQVEGAVDAVDEQSVGDRAADAGRFGVRAEPWVTGIARTTERERPVGRTAGTLLRSQQLADGVEALAVDAKPRPPAALLALQQARLDELAEVVAHRCLGPFERFVEVAGARLAVTGGGDEREEAQAGGVGEHLEDAGQLDGGLLTERRFEDRRATGHHVDGVEGLGVHDNILTDIETCDNISTFIETTRSHTPCACSSP